MQSYQSPGNVPWKAFNANFAPNDHAFAGETWDYMVEWIEAGANAYIFPHLFLDEVGLSLDQVRPWPQNSLLVVVNGNLIYTPAYYVALHVSRYVDEGAIRLETDGGDALAFRNPDDSIVTILHNSGSSDAATTLDVGGTMLQFDVPAYGWATVNWQE
jgi:glucosylceramidase